MNLTEKFLFNKKNKDNEILMNTYLNNVLTEKYLKEEVLMSTYLIKTN